MDKADRKYFLNELFFWFILAPVLFVAGIIWICLQTVRQWRTLVILFCLAGIVDAQTINTVGVI